MEDLHNCDAQQNYLSSDSLKIKVVQNGYLFPIFETAYGVRFGGVTDGDFNFIRESLPERVSPWYMNSAPLREQYSGRDFQQKEENITYVDEDVIFLGHLSPHLGHFITEGLSRLWPLLNPEIDYSQGVFIASNRPSAFSTETYKLFTENTGRKNMSFKVQVKPKRYKSIHIPEPSIRMHDFVHHSYKETIDVIKSSVEASECQKIYLSKNGSQSQRANGEPLLIDLFADNGYQQIALSELKAKELFSLMKGCISLVSTSGTASHQSVFMEDHQHCVCLNRSAHVHPLQTMINTIKSHKEEYIDVFLHSSECYFGDKPCFIYPTDHLLRYFRENNLQVDPLSVARDARLIQSLESEKRQLDWLFRTGVIPFEDTLRKNQLPFKYKP